MRIHPIDNKIRKLWKDIPIRIPGNSTCRKCSQDTLLVQSMEGGFVTRNCPECGNSENLPNVAFKKLDLWVACPECNLRMVSEILPDKNYGYVCGQCELGIPLHALLPRWEDIQIIV